MAYRTVLVHVDDTPRAATRIRAAAALVRAAGGHLVGAAPTGVSRFLYQDMLAGAPDPSLALHLGFLRERALTALDAFAREAAAAAAPSFEARLIDDEAGAGLALQARAADLVVLGQAEPGAAAPPDFAAYVVLHAGRPVLVLPYAGAPPRFDGKVLLAWDGGREAALALQLALPLLRRAASVRVAVFEPAAAGRTLADALAADPLPLLARHGVQAELSQHVAGGKRGRHRHEVGDALLALAAELPADLLVMGAYGHSRMRETILGGVTRTVFDRMTIPVLMAH